MARRAWNPTLLAVPVAPYSQVVRGGPLIITAGQVAQVSSGEIVAKGDARQQTRQVLENLRTAIEATGGSLDDVIKTTVYLSDRDYYQAMNDVYHEFFGSEPPARSTVCVGLMNDDWLIEIEAICWLPEIVVD